MSKADPGARIRTQRLLLLALSLLITARVVRAQELTTVLSVAPGAAMAGTSVELELVAFNAGTTERSFTLPAVIPASLVIGGASWPLELCADSPSHSTVAPGGFIARSYRLSLPNAVAGPGVIEVTLPDSTSTLRAAIEVAAVAVGPAGGNGVPIPANLERPPARVADETSDADATVLGRTLAGRLQAHEPIYFLYGTGPEAAKFQFSFKYRVADLGARTSTTTRGSLQLGYTERSLWDVDSASSPFYDTSYMPELFWEWIKIPPRKQSGVSFNGLQAGFKHESNGKDGADSRSVNTAYLRVGFFVGPVDGWRLILSPEVWTYLDDADDIAEYRGYGRLRATFGKANGLNLKLTAMAGKDLDHRSVQLDMTYPVHVGFLDMSVFVMAQYFNGYGESVLSYDRKTESLRFGFAVVR